MSEYTPGPMCVEYDGPSRPIIIASDHSMLSISKLIDGRWTSYNEEDNDAHRFAATSDMYEALKGLRRGSCFCECGIDNPMMRGRHTAACIAAQSAIAKAEGK